ncbi:MAG: peptide MFS transporter [Alphaproteobacteria bacterium]|uniref:peptide MFS transporter n=1 Tax=Bradyrhizobium sp. TaxID=376 RepID=UPI001EC6DA04|nr:peptide MFS transporter [Bradyrhizobium sp.]MBV9570793.1 peptide MFS transporter [Alphaproteobacteria bacterium]MBV9979044.1 peptide MFS transporter [Bradyrhizobium sp.]
MTAAEAASISHPPSSKSRTFFGQPRALGYLAFTEAWERFSYYGMTALLVLYMSQALFTPEHIGNIAGFPAFRAMLESVFGKMSTLALASQVYGLYTGFVYFTPLIGGWIADRFIGRRNAVVIGALLMSGGHIAMAFDESFLLALALLITGCGLLKGNISTQVGQLYAEDDAPGRMRGFSIFSMAINVGAVAGPLACGLLAQLYGWHVGFGVAGLLMLFALVTYLAGYRLLSETARGTAACEPAAALTQAEKRAIAALILVMAITIPHSIAFYQNSNIGFVWINGHVDRMVGGFLVPTAWFGAAMDSLISIACVPFLFALWRWQARHGGEPNEITKIGIGAALAAAANLVLAGASLLRGPVSPLFPMLYETILGVAFIWQWPTLLALVSRVAPQRLKSTLMGAAFLTLFVANMTIGRIGALYEVLAPAEFWAMNAAIAATGSALALLLARPLKRVLDAAIAVQLCGDDRQAN